MSKDRPDNYSENANILPYGSNVSAPAIVVPDVCEFVTERSNNARNYFLEKLNVLQREYDALLELSEQTNLVYNAKYNFIPRVGHVYHLYWTGEEYTLSLIENWKKFEYIGSFLFTADNVWERVENGSF